MPAAPLPPRPLYIALLSLRPPLTNMRQHSRSQGLEFKSMDVTRNQDLVALWSDMPAGPHPTDLPITVAEKIFARRLGSCDLWTVMWPRVLGALEVRRWAGVRG
jgi:hypothetical protein